MSEYDITTGYLFRQFPDDLVRFVAGATAEDIELADPVLKQTRYADATAYATIKSPEGVEAEVIVHIEFQTDADGFDTQATQPDGYNACQDGRIYWQVDRYVQTPDTCVSNLFASTRNQ